MSFVNPALESFFGRKAKEFLGESVSFPLVAGETTEVEILRGEDEAGTGEMHVVETEWEGTSAYLLTLREITERKRAEEAVRESEKKAVRALNELTMAQQSLVQAEKLSSLGQLAAGMAHELNNPLYSIWALSELIDERDLSETLKKELALIHEEAGRSIRIVQNLLSFARRNGPGKVYASINASIAAAIELRRYELELNNIEIEMQLEPDLPLTMADAHQIQQVALNLIINAEQAMLEAHGGGRLLVKTEQVGPMIHFVASDSGPGISKENLGRIFDPFFTSKDVGKGTGLGLSICYGIIQKHGGTIRVESGPPGGTTFTVELPIVCPTTATESNGGSTSPGIENALMSSAEPTALGGM